MRTDGRIHDTIARRIQHDLDRAEQASNTNAVYDRHARQSRKGSGMPACRAEGAHARAYARTRDYAGVWESAMSARVVSGSAVGASSGWSSRPRRSRVPQVIAPPAMMAAAHQNAMV